MMGKCRRQGLLQWQMQRQPKYCELCVNGDEAKAQLALLEDKLARAIKNQQKILIPGIKIEIQSTHRIVSRYEQHMKQQEVMKPWVAKARQSLQANREVNIMIDYVSM